MMPVAPGRLSMDDLLAPGFGHSRRHQPRHHVGAAAGGKPTIMRMGRLG
jgi:hypothetical protein